MNAIQLQAGAGATNRRVGFHHVTDKNVKRRFRIPLACALLVTLGCCSAQAAAEATYKLFGGEVGGYASKEDLPAIVNKALGSRAAIADWDEIKTRYGGSEADLKWDKLFASANSNDVSGVYTLVSVNGKKVPASVSHEGAALQVRSGAFTIKADGTCRSKVTFVPPSGAEATVEVTATYRREGSKLNMQWQGAGTTTGTLEGDTFTMENEGMVFAYRK